MTRRTRLISALLTLLALLFSQLAVSAYVCPMESGVEAAMAASEDVPLANANVCDSHCKYGSSASGHASADVWPVPLIAAYLLKPVVVSTTREMSRALVDHASAVGRPPPWSLFGVLRI